MRFVRRLDLPRLAKFVAAGVVNTIFGYVVFLILIRLIPQAWLALFLMYVIGLMFNYVVFSYFVFTGRVGSVPRYLGTYLIAFGVNFVLYSALHAWIPSPAIVQLLCLPPVALATYLLMQFWSFAGEGSAKHGRNT